jgi:hypothetical protein
LDRQGIAVVVAAGRANHAGEGGWAGLTGNSSVFGTEAECAGDGDWTDAQYLAYPKVNAAYCDLIGCDASMVCGHNEWAPGRKIDIRDWPMSLMRQQVAELLHPMNGGIEVWVLNYSVDVAPAGEGGVVIGLPAGFKTAVVDFWLDCPHNKGAGLWGAQAYEGGAEAVGLWAGGKQWELWLPGRQRSYSHADISAGMPAIKVENRGPEGPVIVTVSGT